jgi:hypothetical protein
VRSPVSSVHRFAFAVLLTLLVPSPVSVARPDAVVAHPLPQHCDELVHGDCDDPWFCLVACLMETLGLEDYCSQHPDSPQCQ